MTTKEKELAKKGIKERRRRFRFKPEADKMALLYLDERRRVAALIDNESYAGCCLVVMAGPPFKVEKIYKIRIADGLEIKAEIRWIKKLDDIALQIGFQFVD